jgi:hypothetical protein
VHLRDQLPQVVHRLRGADPVRELDRRVEADEAAFVLQVDLDRIDSTLGNQFQHALPKRSVGPAVGRDVHAAYGCRQAPGLDRDRQRAPRFVSRFVRDRERQLLR